MNASSDPAADTKPETGAEAAVAMRSDEAEGVDTRSAAVGEPLHGMRLDRALVTLAPEFSRAHLQHLITLGCVKLDGLPAATASRRVRAGQTIEVRLVPTDESRAYRPEPLPLTIVHEDAHLLVIDKPAGLVVHPAPGHWSGTLLNGLLAHHAAASEIPRAGIVHRLDMDTSGLMVVAKSLAAATALVRAIAERRVQRHYLALAHGDLGCAHLTIDAPIGRDPRSRIRMAVVADGKPARTDVVRVAARDDVSALRCRLHTGRTHQIRVHLSQRGHPLLADALYGGRPALGLTRQALHAHRLALQHPVTGVELAFEAPPPPDFAAGWAAVTQPQR